jgi:hypothetical protein
MPRSQFKLRYKFFADTPNVAGSCRVILKIYDGEPILTSSQISGRIYILQYRCFNEGSSVNLFQMTETGFAEQ